MKYPVVRRLLLAAFLGMALPAAQALADTEIDMGDSGPAPTPKPAVQPTAVPEVKAKPTPTAEFSEAPSPTPETKAAEEEPTPTIAAVHGTVKMTVYYNAGIKNYQDKEYDSAIRALKVALEMKDPYSPNFYRAEAAAMLGVIYQFHIIHYDKALEYYKMALKFEKNNPTAKRHLKEVQRAIEKGE